ncbi:DNA adenine methylase [Microvirga arabica]|uniref:DNA adenine methylase n=1 Tax=Microvirga arabica TaxID=1128671 RepID=UPI00193A3CEB|nr:DNA adenine methylase [Microvirga arabica]MBM1170190.1 DNA adenine methylase [Microvirga arabica]
MTAPTRPLLRWMGSKWRLAPWVISHLPPHDLYCEPFGGSASVLMRKPRSKIEILGDLDDELLNLYAVVRDPALAAQLMMVCSLTPFSDAEFRCACEPMTEDRPVERARRLVVRHAMQVSPDVRKVGTGTGFRRYSGEGRKIPAFDWATYPEAIAAMSKRLQRVLIERDDAVKTIRRHDRPNALFYIDPPYVHSTRKAPTRGYAHEMDDAAHRELLDCILSVKGMVVLSGYGHHLYDEALTGWRRLTREAQDHARNAREEVLWISPRGAEALDQGRRQLSLLDL